MVQIEVFRSGWYGGLGGRKVFGPVQVPGIVQTRIEPGEDGIIVCKWKDPYALQTQKDWTTGVYLVKLTNIINPEAMMQMLRIEQTSLILTACQSSPKVMKTTTTALPTQLGLKKLRTESWKKYGNQWTFQNIRLTRGAILASSLELKQ